MKDSNKFLIGICLWFVLGLFSLMLGWTHFVIWVLSAYIYYIFVEPYTIQSKEKK